MAHMIPEGFDADRMHRDEPLLQCDNCGTFHRGKFCPDCGERLLKKKKIYPRFGTNTNKRYALPTHRAGKVRPDPKQLPFMDTGELPLVFGIGCFGLVMTFWLMSNMSSGPAPVEHSVSWHLDGQLQVGGGLDGKDHTRRVITDFGYDGRAKGWYDAQCVGEATDYCRWVGDPSWFSCTLSGEQSVTVMEQIGDEWYSHPGVYAEEDFVLQQLGEGGLTGVHKKCSDSNYLREAGSSRGGGFISSVLSLLSSPFSGGVGASLFNDPWSPCVYTHDVLDNGFDDHEPTYEKLQCMRTDNGTVIFKGFVQCYNGATNCFFQLHWGLERVLTGVAMAVMPFECRPDVEQHIVGYAGTNDRPVKVAVRPDGNVVLLSDGGLTSWFLRIEGESSVGRLEADTATGNSPADIAVLEPWTPPKRPFVAITIPMTSNKLGITTAEDSPLMRIVLPSLMRALSTDLVKFNVVVYAGYDTKDEFWVNAPKMDRIFTTKVDMGGSEPAKGTLTLKWIQCDCESMVCNTNCISRIAYRDGADYYFRSNDDTEFMTNIESTHNWISSFAAVLSEYDPPNVGVVGPLCRQGNQEILTHDFVHRNHMDMFFQSYYPSLLSNWWCDDWITTVYGVERTTKHEGVEVYHHTFVSRYDVDYTIHNSGDLVQVIDDGVGQIRAWLDKYLADSLETPPSARDSIVYYMEGVWPPAIARKADAPVMLVTTKPQGPLVDTLGAGAGAGGEVGGGAALAAPVPGWSSDAFAGDSSSSDGEKKQDVLRAQQPSLSFNYNLEDAVKAKAAKNAFDESGGLPTPPAADERGGLPTPPAGLSNGNSVLGGVGGGDSGGSDSLAEKLKVLWDLTEQGILTKEEFNAKKQELLSRI